MAKKETTAVAVANENAVATFGEDLPDYLRGQTGPARGSEDVGTKDIALPRLEIVQSESPIKEQNEDAKDGMLYNSATGDLLGDTAYFVPVYYRTEYLVWRDKDDGGGFFGAFFSEGEAKERAADVIASERIDPDMIEIVDTPVHYGLLVFPDGRPAQQMVISMPKSKAKVSRKWNAVIQIAGGDRFSRVYKITTFKDKNKQGKTFQNFVVQPAGFPPEAIYRLAEQTYNVFKQQGVKAAHDTVVDDGEGHAGSDRGDI